ncbi:MAG: flagellar hook-basal body protein [Clostridia bacterium]|nr:flagellar hook-basal body protein [Clostridia bacterium]
MRSIYSARNGIIAQQTRLDTIGNNLANINNEGFKKSRIDFEDCLYQTIRRVEQPQDDLNLRMGHGTKVGATTRLFTQGKLLMTGNNTDIAIDGKGFFAIENPNGVVQYTRSGTFAVDRDGFLVDGGDGSYVLDSNYDRIYVANTNFGCATNGALTVNGEETVSIGIFDCMNPQGLELVGADRFAVSENSGAMNAANRFTLRQSYVEGSNVELEKEITAMIRAQRALSLAGRALTTADNMDAQANQLRQ